MSPNKSASRQAPPSEEAIATNAIVVETRFGRFAFDPDQSIEFPRGVPGFPAHKHFGLTALPDARLQQFMLLQCLADAALSFLVQPISAENGPIAPEDIAAARDDLGIAPENLAIVLMVSIRKIGGETQISVNLRAPIFMDASRRTGAQVVLPNGQYPVRHVLMSRPSPAAEQANVAIK
jgi:flagellar assembly factor FliW